MENLPIALLIASNSHCLAKWYPKITRCFDKPYRAPQFDCAHAHAARLFAWVSHLTMSCRKGAKLNSVETKSVHNTNAFVQCSHMQYGHLRSVDLNLLIAFHALMEERSVTGAARRMFVSQPAMSRMFDRLQEMFEDELLIRIKQRYEPTHRAAAIHKELQQMLPKIEALFVRAAFNPAQVTDLIRIETSDWGATMLVTKLICILVDCAPGIQVDVVPRRVGFGGLEENDVDLMLGNVSAGSSKISDGLRSERLFDEKLVCLVRSGHPLAKRRRITLQDYLNAQHVLLTNVPPGRRSPVLCIAERQQSAAEALARLGRKPDVRARIPYFIPLRLIVENTDLIAAVPLQIAKWVKTTKTCIVPAPVEFHGFSYFQFWHSRNDSNLTHKWVRELLRSLAKDISSFTDPLFEVPPKSKRLSQF
jgi:DNA-binding transcriptional LysR family regulator